MRSPIALAAAVAGVFLLHALFLNGVAEDAFITFRYARHLIEGHGLVWNVGEAPVEGYTNFLWVLLTAGFLRMGVDPGLGAQLLGVLASLLTLLYAYRAGTRILGWPPPAALVPCLFLALCGPFATWAGAGLETNLFGALLLVGVFHFARYWQDAGRRHLWICFGALGLSMLTRPEGALVYAIVLAVGSVAAAGRRGAWRAFAAPVGVSLGLFAVYFAWRWSYFGYPLPNTFYAKTGGSWAQYARGARYAGLFLLHFGLPWAPLLVVASLTRPPAPARDVGRVDWLREHALLVTCGAIAVAYTAYIVWVGGDYMAMYRFFAPILPFLYLLAGWVVRRAAAEAGSPGRRTLVAGGIAVAALGTLVHSTPLEARLFEKPDRIHGNYRGVQTERWHVSRLSTLGHFFARYASPGESLATDGIGAIAYYSRLRVFDVHGLVDPHIAHQRRQAERIGTGWAGHDRSDFAYVLAKRPTYVMFGRELRPRKPPQALARALFSPEITSRYELVSVWLEDFGNGEAGWFSFLQRRDRDAARARGPAGQGRRSRPRSEQAPEGRAQRGEAARRRAPPKG